MVSLALDHELSTSALLVSALDTLLALPFNVQPVLWREYMPDAEMTIASWALANDRRVFLVDQDEMLRVVRRDNKTTMFTWRRDTWRGK